MSLGGPNSTPYTTPMNPNAQNLLLEITPHLAPPPPKTLRMLTFRDGGIREAGPNDPVIGVSEGTTPVQIAFLDGPCFIEAGEAIALGDHIASGPEGAAVKAGKRRPVFLALSAAAPGDAILALPCR